ncbi:MAG: ABC transporter permease [Desulfovibrionales bacterium]
MFGLGGYETLLLEGAWLTIMVGLSSMTLAIVFGLTGALAKLSSSLPLRAAAEIYTTLLRGIPELVLILLIYYGFPTMVQDIGSALGFDFIINFNPFLAGTCTIGIIYGAFATEVFRGAYLAVPKGQIEAAQAAGMSSALAFRRVTLPQMWRFALPGLGNVWMVLIKATALISIIQLPELMRNADIAARSTRKPFTAFFLASCIYLAITLVSMLVQKRAEQWANRGIRRS